jgi:hypothetical protein
MSTPIKENSSNLKVEINKKVKTGDRQELKQLLLERTEQRTEEKFSDKNLDRENEKIKLISGEIITIRGLRNYITQYVQPYSPKFPKEFYIQINRLNNWNKSESELYLKPPIVGRYTNEIIYGRYPKEILPMLQNLNPYMRLGFRLVKHFQWLSEEGQKQLETYIEDAIQTMKECNDWEEFREKYARKYGLPFQLSIF